jgi:hypothetical protein
MPKNLKHLAPDGRGMTALERMAYLASIEDDLDDLTIGGHPVKTLAHSLKEDDDYYYGVTDE